jgi:hypothetical protein
MALLEPVRSADVQADMAASVVEIPLRDFERFRKQHPHASERIMRISRNCSPTACWSQMPRWIC